MARRIICRACLFARDTSAPQTLPGHTMEGTDRSRMMGVVMGKALGSPELGADVIQVTLQ